MRILTFDVGIKNLSFCLVDTDPFTIIQWKTVSTIDKDLACKKVGIEELTLATLVTLQTHFDDNSAIDLVLVENQPGAMNGLMKSISMVIYTYFNMMVLHGQVKQVRFISATNKLKCKLNTDKKAKLTYPLRKKKSVELCAQYLVQIAPDRVNWFNAIKKADDYSDTFLYIMYYMESEMVKGTRHVAS